MVLDVFAQKLGDEVMPRLDDDHLGLVAVQMLDAVQTVVDVLTDNDGGKGWTVGFDPTVNAYTDRSARRHIVVSVKPLLDAKPGDSLAKVAAIMTGFAVHEVGHTKLDFYSEVEKRWPGKTLPKTLANIIEDVVLEKRTVERFPGFADHGDGNVFRPTLEWVAELTSPKTPLQWGGSTGHRVNIAGQIVRYREFVRFTPDQRTQDALVWVEQWAEGITPQLTPKGCVELIEAMLAYLKATDEPELPVDEPEGELPDFPSGNTAQTIPDEDDDTEGDGEGEGNGGGGDDDTEGDDGESQSGTEGEGDDTGSGGMDSDDEGDAEGDAENADEGDGTGGRSGDGNDADTMNRTEAPKGANDGTGKGGSGQAVAEASDEGDVDEGFDEADMSESFDKVSDPEANPYKQHVVANAEAEERVTTRMDAGAHGKMRVIFR
jgi:hypothetical protein